MWPRMMKLTTAARYCDMSVATFEKLNPPRPVAMQRPDGVLRYDQKHIDAWLDKLAGKTPRAPLSSWEDVAA